MRNTYGTPGDRLFRYILSPPSFTLVMLQLILNAGACVGLVGVVVWAYLRKLGSRLPLPPSPPTQGFLGHLLPPRKGFLTIAQWIDEYGPLITIPFRNTERRNCRSIQSRDRYNGETG
ncbi:hypothetical protein BDR07DRAFT_51033 [Suillus spraguei]|nr:hypothetical protein BDR07DRAFT_51033 [Suillus spraguei]